MSRENSIESSHAEDFVRNLPDIWYKDAFGKETKEHLKVTSVTFWVFFVWPFS